MPINRLSNNDLRQFVFKIVTTSEQNAVPLEKYISATKQIVSAIELIANNLNKFEYIVNNFDSFKGLTEDQDSLVVRRKI